jgi:hypothetical protein
VDVLIPFPAQPWRLVRRSWESARAIEEALGSDPDNRLSAVKPSFHQIGALDTSTAFDKLLTLTQDAKTPAPWRLLAPNHSVAMCILLLKVTVTPLLRQPRTYALNYSTGYEVTYAYWIKHEGIKPLRKCRDGT